MFESVIHHASTPESDISVSFLPARKTFDNFMGLRSNLEDIFWARLIWSWRMLSSLRFMIRCCQRRPMSRDLGLYLDDMAQAIRYVKEFTAGMTFYGEASLDSVRPVLMIWKKQWRNS